MTRLLAGILAIVSLVVMPALAQAQQPSQGGPPVRVRGTIEKVEGNTVTVKAGGGKTETLKLADNARITAMVKATLADIKVGSFIGVTAMPQPDGTQKAIGLHIFMDAQRGVVPARFSHRAAQYAGGEIRAGQHGRREAGRADNSHRRQAQSGRHDRRAEPQCRPRRRRAADVIDNDNAPT